MQRTQVEIMNRINLIEKQDFFGFQSSDLIGYLDYNNALLYVNEDIKQTLTETEWDEKYKSKLTPEEQIKDYVSFAWDKANDCRGLSASRSIEHMKAWLWLDGQDVLADRMNSIYEYYGKTCLVVICQYYDIDWKQYDDGVWVNNECDEGGNIESILAKHGIQL